MVQQNILMCKTKNLSIKNTQHQNMSTFLVSPSCDEARRPRRHHGSGLRQTNGADFPRHVDGLAQVHQGDVVGDVRGILLIHEALVSDYLVHLEALLRRGNVQGGVHVVLSQTHAVQGGFVQRAEEHMEHKYASILQQ